MLLGRFLPIVAVLALAGLLARQPRVAPVGRDALHRHAPVLRARRGHRRARRRDHLPARPGPEPPRGGTGMTAVLERPTAAIRAAPVGAGAFRPALAAGVAADRAAQARPAPPGAQPRDVRGVGRLGGRHRRGDRSTRACSRGWIAVWLWFTVVFANLAEAVAEGRGRAQADALRGHAHRHRGATRRDGRGGPGDRPARRRPRRRRGRADDPGRRRDRRGHRHRRRVGDHRRVRAGGPRVRRRPVLGHRRDHRALRPHRRADHRAARRVVRRPDDRAGRGRAAAEDAERDRADDPARRR